MSTVARLLFLIDAFAKAEGLLDSTLSSRIFDDGKVIERLKNGGDLTTRRAEVALKWLSENWPDGVDWPAVIARPAPQPEPVA